MQFTISAATLLAIVSAANAQTAGFDAITAPAKDEVVPACSSYTLTWDYVSTYAGTVSIQLLEGATSTTLQLGPVIASMYLPIPSPLHQHADHKNTHTHKMMLYTY